MSYLGREQLLRRKIKATRIRDHKLSIDLTSHQWSKRILAQLALDHPDLVENYLTSLGDDHKNLIRNEVNTLSKKLITYRGYPIEGKSNR